MDYVASLLEVSASHLVAYLSAHGAKGLDVPVVPRPRQDANTPSSTDEVRAFFGR